METSLVIMAAGLGSRFKGGIKQLAPVGEHGETLMEYSVREAVRAGFDRVIFIIRHEIEGEFIAKTGHLADKYGVKVQYAFQDINDVPVKLSIQRTKPWGTAHALLAARDIIETPFAVINSDDYYGQTAFVKVHDFLVNNSSGDDILLGCMVGYVLERSISANGTVNRALCETDGNRLTGLREYYDISSENGVITGRTDCSAPEKMSADSLISMNLFGLPREIIPELNGRFEDFLSKLPEGLDGEFILPDILGEMIGEKKLEITVLRSEEDTFGMTRSEDLESVRLRLSSLKA